MRNSILILIASLVFSPARTQSRGGFEQLYYIHAKEGSVVPIVHYTTKNKWYGEARYNYDEARTFAVYAGRTFSSKGTFSCSATPVIGGLIGKLNGGSAGVNMDLGFNNLFFSIQSQYTFSMQQKNTKYFFSWSELGYQATPWLFGGMALQHTNFYKESGKFEPGGMLGFSMKNWTLPVYMFNQPGGDPYFVLGINWAWAGQKKLDKATVVRVSKSEQ
jgi:hypothetical protein